MANSPEYNRAYYLKHKERYLRQARVRYLRNRESIIRSLSKRYSSYKGSCKERGWVFPLSISEFVGITSRTCYYCGDAHWPMGIDRVDNERGYESDNIVSACRRCNIAKNVFIQSTFIAMCHKVARNHPQM